MSLQTTPETRELKWSPAEKAVSRRAFDLALGRERDDVIHKAKERAAQITEVSELWDLEDWLGKRRRHIDHTFDYRYSVLPMVFAILIQEGRLREAELDGLGEDKLNAIRDIVAPLRAKD